MRTGEITDRDLERARFQLKAALESDDPRWLGEVVTSGALSDAVTPRSLPRKGMLQKSPGAPLAWHHGDALLVFAAGETHRCPVELGELVQTLCADEPILLEEALQLHDQAGDLLTWLIGTGSVEYHEH